MTAAPRAGGTAPVTTPDYQQLLHRLGRLRTDGTDTRRRAEQTLAAETERVERLRVAVDAEREAVLDAAGRLQAAAPDLRAPVDAAAEPPSDLETELAAAHRALDRVGGERRAALRAGQLPALLPRAHHLVRNLVVHGAAMVACVVAQLVLTGLLTAEVLPDGSRLWIGFITPVLFLIIGWFATGVAGTPRLPMTDKHGTPMEFTVYRSPRLGAVLAVVTIAGYFLWS